MTIIFKYKWFDLVCFWTLADTILFHIHKTTLYTYVMRPKSSPFFSVYVGSSVIVGHCKTAGIRLVSGIFRAVVLNRRVGQGKLYTGLNVEILIHQWSTIVFGQMAFRGKRWLSISIMILPMWQDEYFSNNCIFGSFTCSVKEFQESL